MKTITLITGGVRSGKSRFAFELAETRLPEERSGSKPGQRNRELAQARAARKTFMATAEPLDDEMRRRISRHQAERGRDFATVEEPLYLSRAVAEAARNTDLILIDCLTLWINNLLHRFAAEPENVHREIESFLATLEERTVELILVTNEVGLGIVPDNPLVRCFIDEQGRLNQELARMSDEVIFMVSGIPQVIKGVGIHADLD